MKYLEDQYYTIAHFCNYKKYKLAKNLIALAEKDLKQRCLEEDLLFIIKVNKVTNKRELAFPLSVLEEYFTLWIK